MNANHRVQLLQNLLQSPAACAAGGQCSDTPGVVTLSHFFPSCELPAKAGRSCLEPLLAPSHLLLESACTKFHHPTWRGLATRVPARLHELSNQITTGKRAQPVALNSRAGQAHSGREEAGGMLYRLIIRFANLRTSFICIAVHLPALQWHPFGHLRSSSCPLYTSLPWQATTALLKILRRIAARDRKKEASINSFHWIMHSFQNYPPSQVNLDGPGPLMHPGLSNHHHNQYTHHKTP